MRNLKKTLCLILALVFVLGLCAVSAADYGSYGDVEDIDYESAVKVMSGLGILQGDDNDQDGVNDFRPKDPITRAQAAKIIAYIVLGKDDAEIWPASQAFTDVTPSDSAWWAAKYIAFCSYAGIIIGVGDGSFHPNENVTQVAFAKMLLAAAGYGQKDEFVGEKWVQNVAALAMQNKLNKGLISNNWEVAATREECAQLAYNGLLNMPQVVYSNDTSSYVPKSVGGGTFGFATWGIQTDEGVVTSNKANDSVALGTVLAGTGATQAYYVTDRDDDAGLIGHYVRVTYRLVTENGSTTAEAYFVDDECTEVDGKEAAKHDDAAATYYFTSGQQVGTPIPAKAARATAEGTFVLDGNGKVVSYKTEGYFVATLTLGSDGAATVVEPYGGSTVKVAAPAGAKNGDILTVFHSGDIYTAKACVKKTGVAITQSQVDKATGYYVYNNGSIYLSKSDLLSSASVTGFTKLNGTAQLELGSSYTLYFDSEGGCIGFADKQTTGVVVSKDYVMLMDVYSTRNKDAYGVETTVYYAQVIRESGAVESLPISKETYDAKPATGVYKVSTVSGISSFGTPGSDELAYVKYSTEDPVTDYSQAKYIWYNGLTLGDLKVATNTKPQLGSYVYYVYTVEKQGTVNVRRVKTVWFTVPESSAVVMTDSYIYVASTAPAQQKVVNGAVANFYEGYLNGAAMSDLTTDVPPAKVGIATYTRNTQGVYTLSYLPDGDGSATGVRSIVLDGDDNSYFFLNGKFWVVDAYGSKQSMDYAGVKIVKVGAAAASTVNLGTVDAINNAMLEGHKISVTFAEIVTSEGHKIGGGVLYVTAIS